MRLDGKHGSSLCISIVEKGDRLILYLFKIFIAKLLLCEIPISVILHLVKIWNRVVASVSRKLFELKVLLIRERDKF